MADAKPVACGACGAEKLGVEQRPLSFSKLQEAFRTRCECGVSGRWMPSWDQAVAAWNRMWAGREAKGPALVILRRLYVMSCVGGVTNGRRVDLALEERTADNRLSAWIGHAEIDAALAELGLDAARGPAAASTPDGEGVGL